MIEKKIKLFSCIHKVKSVVERKTENDYFSDQFLSYLQKEVTRQVFSCLYKLEQNGVAEWKNWMIEEAARAMLEEKNMPKILVGQSGQHGRLPAESDICKWSDTT